MAPETRLPILALDFDGVIHRYSKGWGAGAIYDPPTEGFREWAEEARKHFTLVIVSSRLRPEKDQGAEIEDWLRLHDINPSWFEFARFRPPALISIDDRALTFTGRWADFDPAALRAFQPWHAVKGPSD
jgi:sugar/nucleoside kinase (ribokinase family)